MLPQHILQARETSHLIYNKDTEQQTERYIKEQMIINLILLFMNTYAIITTISTSIENNNCNYFNYSILLFCYLEMHCNSNWFCDSNKEEGKQIDKQSFIMLFMQIYYSAYRDAFSR